MSGGTEAIGYILSKILLFWWKYLIELIDYVHIWLVPLQLTHVKYECDIEQVNTILIILQNEEN